jgi:hypothetical protein
MSLKLYYDPYDITCFRGEPTTNLFTVAYPTPNDWTGYFPSTSSYRTIWTPRGVQTASVHRYNNNNPGAACCPSLFSYQYLTGILPSTTYCYSAFYKVVNNDYGNTNFLYRYEYNNGTYLTEGGVWSAANRIPYPGGWYRIFGTFTTQATTNVLNTFSFTYEYNTDNTQIVTNHQLEAKNHLTNYAGPSGTRGVTVANGGGLVDLTGNNNNGDLTYGSYVTSTVFHNNTFYFDGASANNCIRILDADIAANLLTTGKSFTIVVWANKLANATNTAPFLFSYRDTSSNGIELLLYGTGNTSTNFGFNVIKSGGPSLTNQNDAVNTSGWHMYTGVYNNDGMYKNSIVKYYDATQIGSRVSSSNATSAWSKPSTSQGGGIIIGTAPISVNSANSVYNFKGYFGEIRIYDHALTPEEVSTLYKLGIQKHI